MTCINCLGHKAELWRAEADRLTELTQAHPEAEDAVRAVLNSAAATLNRCAKDLDQWKIFGHRDDDCPVPVPRV